MKRSRVFLGLVALLLAGGVLGATAVHADPVCTISWGGGVSNEWRNAQNWSLDRIPTTAALVSIPGGSAQSLAPVITTDETVTYVHAERPVRLQGGSLTLTDAANSSSFASLTQAGGSLLGAADL